jgi:GTP diphosphokinase / guanosine-3',5'-bis(diphosphate) 3'-diphosphatase
MNSNNSINKRDELVLKAFELVKENSSKEQIGHLERVSKQLSKKKLGEQTELAAILQAEFSKQIFLLEKIEKEFGEETTKLVKECARIKDVFEGNYKKLPPETLTALMLSIATDLRTIIIKATILSDKLKNNLIEDKNKEIYLAKNVYLPLIEKLGISDLGWQISDYCFKIENPEAYNKIKKLINKTREEREKIIKKAQEEFCEILKGKAKAQIFGRPKNFLSIYKKMKKTPFKQMHDIYGIRIICNTERECYEILGEIHSKYNFIKSAFDDYIAKEGKGKGKKGYQSIHTAIMYGKDILEVQIRTWKHHLKTESSLYWEYKQLKKDKNFDKTLSWERQLIEWQKNIGKNTPTKINKKNIFVFTPKNDVISLPLNSTIIDFAYAVHSTIGEKIEKAKVNGELMPLETKLKNLDKIEIIISKKNTIKRAWLAFVASEKAKTKIRRYFGIKVTNKTRGQKQQIPEKRIKLAECCHPLPGEDVIGIKTTKRKIIIHKTDCENIKNIPKEKKIEIMFEKNKGKTKLVITAIDRIGLLAEILEEIKKNKVNLCSTNFNIRKTGFVEAIFELEVNDVKKIEKIITNLEKIPSIQEIKRK